jgi:hypothetical protein
MFALQPAREGNGRIRLYALIAAEQTGWKMHGSPVLWALLGC